MQKIFVFGNGNLSFQDFLYYYVPVLEKYYAQDNTSFLIGDFRGTDVLTLEWLKCQTPHVTMFHLFDRPRYTSDKFKTFVSDWTVKGGFLDNTKRDLAMCNECTHFLGFDFNTDSYRKSGTQKNIEHCLKLNKTRLFHQ